jgi:hypothetical protein
VTAAGFARRVGAHRSTIGRFVAKLLAEPDIQNRLDIERDEDTGRHRYRLDHLRVLWDAAQHVPGPARQDRPPEPDGQNS